MQLYTHKRLKKLFAQLELKYIVVGFIAIKITKEKQQIKANITKLMLVWKCFITTTRKIKRKKKGVRSCCYLLTDNFL